MLDETIEVLTELMIKEDFKNKKENKVTFIHIKKIDLYRFCIKLIKLIQRVYDK